VEVFNDGTYEEYL
jgi:hypothetical protein